MDLNFSTSLPNLGVIIDNWQHMSNKNINETYNEFTNNSIEIFNNLSDEINKNIKFLSLDNIKRGAQIHWEK